MTKRFISLLLITLIFGSCAPAPISLTLPPTATITPSQTPRPTQTTIPTATPYPLLQTDGPYLLFTYDDQNSPLKNFTIVDADGSSRKQFQLPNDGYIWQLDKSVSPDGKWLAYFTGSIEEPYNVTLNLLNLSDETSQLISGLIAPNFPENLDPIVETMVLGDPPIYYADCFEDMECRRSLVERELTNSLFSFDWSPDSQSVAFTAQIKGASSDIYIYDIQAEAIHQLTNELQNIYWLDWAPNSKRILYEICSTPGTGYEGRTLHFTDLEGKTTFVDEEDLYNQRWGEYDWITENLYLFYHPNDTDPPIYDLMILNIDTGQLKEVWPYSADSFAVDKENKTIVLYFKNYYDQNPIPSEGVYMVDTNGNYRKISDLRLIIVEGQKPYPVFGTDYERQLYNIRSNGSIETLEWDNHRIPWISPDGNLLLFHDDKKLALYTISHQLINSWMINEDIYKIIWRPDSLGMFFSTENNIYYLALPDGESSELFVDCSQKNCGDTRFVWLP